MMKLARKSVPFIIAVALLAACLLAVIAFGSPGL